MFWLAEDDCGAAQSAASRSLQSGLDLYLRLRGLQLGAHAKSGGHSSGGVGRGRRVSAWAGFSPIGPRNIRNQLLATTRDEKQQAKHRIPQFFSSLLGHGAMRIVRSLLETSINIEFFRLRPAEFEDYKEWVHVERFKEQEFLREHVEPAFRQLGAEVIAEIEQQMARIRPRFERVAHDGSRRLRGSWCALDLGARAVVTGHQEVYRTINPLASSFVHETMYGMIKHFDAAKDSHRVEVPPTLDWSLQALSGAHLCMIKVVKTLSETFAVPCDPTFETLEKEWHYAWTEPR